MVFVVRVVNAEETLESRDRAMWTQIRVESQEVERATEQREGTPSRSNRLMGWTNAPNLSAPWMWRDEVKRGRRGTVPYSSSGSGGRGGGGRSEGGETGRTLACSSTVTVRSSSRDLAAGGKVTGPSIGLSMRPVAEIRTWPASLGKSCHGRWAKTRFACSTRPRPGPTAMGFR